MLAVGDIVEIYAPVAGYKKYHLCICVGTSGAATQFLYLNSDPTYSGQYVIDCSRVPCIPPSDTNKTCFSFTAIPRYTDRQLGLYKAKRLGTLDPALAAELHAFAQLVTTLTRAEKKLVLDALKALIPPT